MTDCSWLQAEFERADRSPAPDGFRPPCDDTWLADMVDALSGLGGKCVASLCTGLKDEEEFDVALFGPVAEPLETSNYTTNQPLLVMSG